MSEHIVVGSTVAAMAAVERIAAAGDPVRWLTTGPAGGAFAPVTVDGRRLELGLRLIEREYVAGENERPAPPLGEYVPGHAGHRPWMGLVADYLDELMPDLRPAPTPRISLNGRVAEDFTLTGRLAALTDLLDRRTCDRIADEVTTILTTTGPAGVLGTRGPAGMTLDEASLHNHGPLFHRIVVDPIAAALVPGGASTVEATQRHKIWAPLYWPETLAQAAMGRTPDFDPQRQFWTDRHGGMSQVVTALDRRITSSPLVTRLEVGQVTGLTTMGMHTVMRFASGHEERAVAPMLGTSPSHTFAAAGIPHHADRVAMSVLWIDVEERHVHHPAPTTFLDDEVVFRVCSTAPHTDTSGTPRRTFSVELRHAAPPDTRRAIRSMIAAGVIADTARPTAVAHRRIPAFAVPSVVNRLTFDQAQADLRDALPASRLLGSLAGHGADPLNEQLFSGLRAALEVCGAHV